MKTISTNKKAFYDYEILDTIEAGLELLGPEVKSLRLSKCNLKGSFCRFVKNELFMFGVHIGRYENRDLFSKLSETRERKLLMHRKQLNRWHIRITKEQHLTMVPVEIYFNDKNIIKVKIALVRGKKLHDKRESDKNTTLVMKERRDLSQY